MFVEFKIEMLRAQEDKECVDEDVMVIVVLKEGGEEGEEEKQGK